MAKEGDNGRVLHSLQVVSPNLSLLESIYVIAGIDNVRSLRRNGGPACLCAFATLPHVHAFIIAFRPDQLKDEHTNHLSEGFEVCRDLQYELDACCRSVCRVYVLNAVWLVANFAPQSLPLC